MNKSKNVKFSFYLLSVLMFIISLAMLYNTLKNVNYISKTLKQRKTTVVQLKELYSELEPFLVDKQKLLSESEKRDIIDINTILNDLNIPYTVSEDDSIERENVSFVTQTVTINNMKLSNLKTIMDNLLHEWPYINIQRVQISSTDNETANLKINLVFIKVL